MQTRLAPDFQGTPAGLAAEAILRKCVHCGFCTATCPTYQLLGDELDGPRGRIYLIKQVLEGTPPSQATQQHLDRCLTCRNCETTCPSGVEYGRLVEIGRQVVDERVRRPARERLLRALLRAGLTSRLFAPAVAVGQAVRALLPSALQAKVPVRAPAATSARSHAWPARAHARRVLLPAGCVQPALRPGIDAATARVLDVAGVQAIRPAGGGCCGAIRAHNGDPAGSLDDMRRNIDAWWPTVAGPDGPDGADAVEAIVSNASGCGVTLKDYGHALAHDPAYADKAARISALVRDLSELAPALLPAWIAHRHARCGTRGGEGGGEGCGNGAGTGGEAAPRLLFHPPCTLQHGQQLRGSVESTLRGLGFDVRLAANESHLCCGSAGTYSVLQPLLAQALRDRKLAALAAVEAAPLAIVSANVGCLVHLQSGTAVPVRHWVELVDEQLDPA